MIEFNNNLLSVAKKIEGDLIEAWLSANGESSIYIKAEYQRFDGITNLVTVGLHKLSGSNVLDIGCNSGLHSLISSIVANSVVGYDNQELYINRANEAKKIFGQLGHSIKSLNFELNDFTEALGDSGIDAIIAARILYHLGDEKIAILKEYIIKNVNKMIIQCRPSRDVIYSARDIAQTTVYGGLYKTTDCIQFLEDCGFTEYSVWGCEKLWKDGESFPVIFATKQNISKSLK